MTWLKVNLSWLTRSITAVLGVPLDFALDLLAKNFKIGHGAEAIILPRLSWVGVCAAAFLAGRAFGGWRLGAAGRRLLPLHRAVRQVDQRHADARR